MAIENLREAAADVLLTDLLMPTMNGRELIAIARRLYPDIRCLIMSGHQRDESIRNVTWVEKPIDIPLLLAKIAGDELARQADCPPSSVVP